MAASQEEKLEEIIQILCRCEQLRGDLLSLRGDSAKTYFGVYKNAELLKRVDTYFFQIFVIQICMILNPREHHSLKAVAQQCIDEPNTSWKHQNSKAEVENLIKTLANLEVKHLNNFKILRDKFWVHRDANRLNQNVSVKYTEALNLLTELQEIFNLLNESIGRSKVRFDNLSDREPAEIRKLAKYSQIWTRMKSEMVKPSGSLAVELLTIMLGGNQQK